MYYNRFVAALTTPENASVTVVGTTGSTSYKYQIAAYNWNGETLGCSELTVSNGNASLSVSNYNRLEWDVVDGAYGYCIFGRVSGVAYGRIIKAETFDIVSPTRLSYSDQGQVAVPDIAFQPAVVNTTARQNWDSILFRPNKSVQAAELNEIQAVGDMYTSRIGEFLFKEGYVVQGCTPTIQVANTVIIDDGRVFVKGKVREIAGATVTLIGTGKEVIGLRVTENIITELDDVALNDPAVGSYNYSKDGSHRREYLFTWVVNEANAVKVYDVQDGGVIVASQQTSDSQIGKLLATRTYEQSGSFVVEPTSAVIKAHDTDSSKLVLAVSTVRAYVYGYRIERSKGTSLEFDKARDYKNVPDEQITKSAPIFIYDVSEQYVSAVNTCYATVRVTAEDVTRGPVIGGRDEMSHTPVYAILEVWQGGTTYSEGVDYIRDGNYVDWSPGGSEPAVGTSYNVTYTYRKAMIKGTRTKTLVSGEARVRGAGSTDDLVNSDIISVIDVSDVYPNSSPDYIGDVDYYLENGQADDSIGVGKINWSPPSSNKPGLGDTYYVTYYYWAHTIEGEFVSADSYDSYDDIGTYGTKNLRDCIDWRCTGGVTPEPDDFNVDYNFYIPRKDLVCITTDGNLLLVKGISDENPQSPPPVDMTMPLFELAVSPYTYGPTDVSKVILEVVRSTMADLKVVERRVNTLEYYNALDQLEKDAELTYTTAIKSGVMVDNFAGSSKADIYFDKGNITFGCAFDTPNNIIQAQSPFTATDLGAILNVGGSVIHNGKRIISLPYTEELEVHQPLASQPVNVNPYNVFKFVGTLILTPETDNWVDTERAPDLAVTSGATAEELSMWTEVQGRGWQMSATPWQESVNGVRNISTKVQGAQIVTTQAVTTERKVTNLSMKPETETKSLGDRIVDTSISPYIRSRWIDIEGHKLRPLTEVMCTIDDRVISLVAVAPTTGSGGKVNTDASGYFHCRLLIPPGTFNVGDREIKIYNSDTPSTETEATAIYSAFGIKETRQQTYITVTSLQPKVTVNTEVKTTVRKTVRPNPNWSDPLAETLLFDESYFITAIGLYFKTKDPDVPITIELRTVENGYPGQHTILTKTMYPADITVSDNATAETKVIFDDIGYIESGKEICIALIANSDNYNVWVATMGANDVTTGQLITKQPYGGVLFKSPNSTTWVADANSDLKFNIYRAEFSLTGSVVFNRAAGVNATIVSLNADVFNPGDYNNVNCSSLWQVDSVAVTGSSPLLTNMETMYLRETATDLYVKCTLSSDSSRYSPTINKERINLIAAKYNVGSTNAYISRNVVLDPNDYDNLKVILDISQPAGTVADVYYSIDDGYTWELLTSSELISTVQISNEFAEYTWVKTFLSSQTQYRIRIDHKTNSPAATPKCMRLRTIAY